VRVTFLTFDPKLASVRYRQLIPIRELEKLGVENTTRADTIIVSKHGWDEKILDRYRHVIYDICDDHLDNENAKFYKRIASRASLITCNSAAMQWRIWEVLKRPSRVIPDPYEMEEKAPSWGENLLWFGHRSNLPDLWREVPALKGYGLEVICNSAQEGITPWSQEAVTEALDRCAVVILPTGKSPCKSANRLIESVRRGKFVVANPLPAYEEFSGILWVGDLREGVDWAFQNPVEAQERVRKCQGYVASKYSPERIGRLWLNALESVHRASESISLPA
jgi:hypothetical protein